MAKRERQRGSARARGYGREWQAVAKLVMAQHIATRGHVCIGYQTAPHESADLTVDHIIPIAAGGTHNRDNLQVLCRSCNARKGARTTA